MNGHQCRRCNEGWVCEAHPNKPWPHGLSWPSWLRCGGAGMPCPETEQEDKAAPEGQGIRGLDMDDLPGGDLTANDWN